MKIFKTLTLALVMMASLSAISQKKYDYGTDSVSCVENLSLFNEFIKQKAYADAFTPWTACMEICPASRKGLYTEGAKMLRSMAKAPENAARKEELQARIIKLYDERIENFGQRGFVLGLKGAEMLRQNPDQACEVKDVLKESITLKKATSKASVISNYYNALYNCYKSGESDIELETLFNEYLMLSDYININIEKYSAAEEGDAKAEKNLGRYVSAKNNLDEFFVQFAECDDIVSIFRSRMEQDPENLELKLKALRIMNRKDCTENDLFLTVAKDVHAAQPAAESAYAIAKKESKNKNYSVALKYMKECLNLCTDCAERTNYLKFGGYLSIAGGDISFARKCANEMQIREPSSGHAYILKGDAVRAMAKSCDDGKLGRYCAYWLAYDYYSRAKSVDKSSSVQKIAGSKMSSARGQFPGKEDVFFHAKKDGDSIVCSCTGESTTVRTR